MYNLLDKVNGDSDIKNMNFKQLGELASDIRAFLIENVTESGGHLASNLGVVELTLALHRSFDLENDRLIFDVGHQSYTHKILTGRKNRFSELRQPGGLSGFTLRSESKYDHFGAGHSSTSISAALGFSEADKIMGRDSYTVAVIGDGAFTGGMVHEALNNCHKGLKLIIVLNENEMSISRNTGRFANLISKLRRSNAYLRTKIRTKRLLYRIPVIGTSLYKITRKFKNFFKNILVRTNYFEEMGLSYIGPVDGYDIGKMENAFKEAKKCGKVAVVHIKTKKGKGYEPAEKDPKSYHSIHPTKMQGVPFGRVFGNILTDMVADDDRICAVTAAMGLGTGLESFEDRYKTRFFDVGIAEEHALTFSAALAAAGMKPYFAVYSTFLQRGYDNVLHDIALQRLPVHICIDRAGLSPSDGATHHGIFDVAFLSQIPNVEIYAPVTVESMRCILRDTLSTNCPIAIRYSNSCENPEIVNEFYIDKDFTRYGVRTNRDVRNMENVVTIITYGSITERALSAARKLNASGTETQVILLEKLKPYNECAKRISELLPKSGKIVFLEEGIKNGGAGMILQNELIKYAGSKRMMNSDYHLLAIDDSFADPEYKIDLYKYCHICEDDVIKAVGNNSEETIYEPSYDRRYLFA